MKPGDEKPTRGRGAQSQPANPHLTVQTEPDYEHFDGDEAFLASLGRPRTELIVDNSQSIVTQNQSPDVRFRYSVNPYRGCEHGCSYCWKYLDLGSAISALQENQ